MRTRRAFLYTVLSPLCAALLAGCGGGGGGGAPSQPAAVSGRVLNLSSGSPPSPHATVTVGGSSVTTDDRGEFTLASVPSGQTNLNITITAQGEQTLTQRLPTLTANTATDLGNIFLLDAGGTYNATATGTVIRSDTTAPVAGARVIINGQATTTDANGAFSISGLPAGLGPTNDPIGQITAQGFQTKPVFLSLTLAAGANAIDPIAVAPPAGTVPGGPADIRGTIAVTGQASAAGVTVTLTDKNTSQVVQSLTTGADGAYGFWVAAGSYTVTASFSGFQTKAVDVTLPSQDQPQTANLTLVP